MFKVRTRAMETVPLHLDDIRGDLIRQEETIIFALIERAQFALNAVVYKRGESDALTTRGVDQLRLERQKSEEGLMSAQIDKEYKSLSFMEYFLSETESMHAKLGRYNAPDENAFFTQLLPKSVVGSHAKPSPLKPNKININDQVMTSYVEKIVVSLCSNNARDDGEYGSTCACDVAVLQALSKRIHYGKFVAEAKFQAERDRFSKMILANDAEGIMAALTNIQVEDSVVERVRAKASRYGGMDGAYKVQPDIIAQLYRDYLIPLNKLVQVDYLLQRLERPTYAVVSDPLALRAAQQLYNGDGLTCTTVEDVFLNVSRNQVAYGVVPIQNSEHGLFKVTQRLLLETDLAVHRSLIEEDGKKGWTRYFVLCTRQNAVYAGNKNLVAFFGVKHQPGSLVNALSALDGINLSTLESIPMRASGEQGQYAFFLEIESALLDQVSTHVLLQRLEKKASFVKLVGHY